jgi:RimJ/RimL family protein N-acetyltransferase
VRVHVTLRDVEPADLPVLFEHQDDRAANEMAAFPARERQAFMAHWVRILADETVRVQAIVAGGRLAGNVLSFEHDGRREVGYWIGREFWGAGVASAALAAFLDLETARPLHAGVARHNAASLRVLEKCGFAVCGEEDDRVILRLE